MINWINNNEKLNLEKFKQLAEVFRKDRRDTVVLGHVRYDSNDLSYRCYFETEDGKIIPDEELLKMMGISFLRLSGQKGLDYITSGESYDLLAMDKHSHKGLKEGESFIIPPLVVQLSREFNPDIPIVAYWDPFFEDIQKEVDEAKYLNNSFSNDSVGEVAGIVDKYIHGIDPEETQKSLKPIWWEICSSKYKGIEHVIA